MSNKKYRFCYPCSMLLVGATALQDFQTGIIAAGNAHDYPKGKGLRPYSKKLVKIIPLKSDIIALALRKRLFCIAKPTVLQCETIGFAMR
ncbi:hypothetical protein [Prevotella falsenii]|uniref:hypothetical protein n=1 Tax=Prevotella falsenii TaxID=515414 RepID=UPI0004682B8B|nr:hypothetical protein [Prevotella falsenii]